MNNLQLIGGFFVAVLLVVLFGFVLPMLISAPSTELVGIGVAVILGLLLLGVALLRNVLGMNPEDDN